MFDAADFALASDPSARVLVFIDGQNLYKACRRLFGAPHCHPHLLAQRLAGVRNPGRVSCRFYTGRPDPRRATEVDKVRHLDRRLAVMRAAGVTVVTRQLRYHWDWGHQAPLPQPAAGVPPQTVTVTPWERPQEKGIDVAIALDVIELALANTFDVGIIVSLDRDLYEIPEALTRLRSLLRRPLLLEAAVPVAPHRHAKTIKGFARTHQITPAVFAAVKDTTWYADPDPNWTPPAAPAPLL